MDIMMAACAECGDVSKPIVSSIHQANNMVSKNLNTWRHAPASLASEVISLLTLVVSLRVVKLCTKLACSLCSIITHTKIITYRMNDVNMYNEI